MSTEYLDWLNDLKNAGRDTADFDRYLTITYPYLIPRNIKGEIDDDYSTQRYGTMYDIVPDGWKEIFLEMCEKINLILDKYECSDTSSFFFYDIKEKFGKLRCYYCFLNCEDARAEEEISRLVWEYEEKSVKYCISCGNPTKYLLKDLRLSLCEDCAPETKHRILIKDNEQ